MDDIRVLFEILDKEINEWIENRDPQNGTEVRSDVHEQKWSIQQVSAFFVVGVGHLMGT